MPHVVCALICFAYGAAAVAMILKALHDHGARLERRLDELEETLLDIAADADEQLDDMLAEALAAEGRIVAAEGFGEDEEEDACSISS